MQYTYMLETVPLGAGLCIQSQDLIESDESMLCQIFDVVLQWLSTEARVCQVVQWPIQLDMTTDFDLLGCCTYCLLIEQIQSYAQ